MNWKKISSGYISDHIYFTARRDKCEMPNGKIVDPYFVVELPPSVCAVAITVKEEIILTRQYRHPIEETIIELPGGFIDPGEEPDSAIRRELVEETGFRFTSFDYLGKVAANPGVLNNYTHLFLARGGERSGVQQLDPNEDIELLFLPIKEVKRMLMENEIRQALHVSCLHYAFQLLEKK